MPTSQTACFLDFDHTLFQTDEFFHVDVHDAFLKLGIDAKEWEESYAAVWPTGYSIEKHLEEAERRHGKSLPAAEVRKKLRESFSDLRRYLYPDVMPFLGRAEKRGAKLYLVSFGDPGWQQYKVKGSGIGKYFDEMYFAGTPGGKAGLIKKQLRGFTGDAVAVDNSGEDLDGIRDATPKMRTYLINRVPDDMRRPRDDAARRRYLEAREYLNYAPRYRHMACRNLEGVAL